MLARRVFFRIDARLDALGPNGFPPGFKALLEDHYPGFGKRYLYGFEDFFLSRTVVQGGPYVALYVGLCERA